MKTIILLYLCFSVFTLLYPRTLKTKINKKENIKPQKIDEKEKAIKYADLQSCKK